MRKFIMTKKTFILSVLVLLLISFWSITAQTGKPQYVIRTERADTTLGVFTIELFPLIAPLHSANFDSLVNIQFYDTTAFHRVIPDFVVQGGDPNSRHGSRETWGYGDSTQATVPAEFSGVSHLRGIIGAARDVDINSATSQFYINVASNTSLDGAYTAYGQVIEGMDIVDIIVNVPVDALDNPNEKIEMFVTKGAGFTNDVPDIPVLTSPLNEEGGLKVFDYLKWEPVDRAVQYMFQLSKSADFASLYLEKEVGTDSMIIQELELGNVQYYWRVRSNNGGNRSEYSEIGNFFSSIEAAELVYPGINDTVSVTPEFQWLPVEGSTAYRLQISTAPTFSATRIVYDVDTITVPFHTSTLLEAGRSHYWRVFSMTDEYEGPKSEFRRFVTEPVTSIGDESGIPKEYSLNQNYPNPFNPSTVIRFDVPEESNVRIDIFNMLGQTVEILTDEVFNSGSYDVKWNASNSVTGIYFYSISAESVVSERKYSSVKKMLLIK